MSIIEVIQSKLPEIYALREKLSINAELSYKEFKTQKIIIEFLENLGIKTSVFFNTGVSAILNQGEECIALRADMDALPVNGVFHACGHDYHMAIVLGVALVLKELNYDKCVKFIFQPAEEAEGGALPMIEEGILFKPTVKEILGFHVWPNLEVGKISVGKGGSMGSVDDFNMNFIGKAGHAAMPEVFINPIYPAVDFIQSIKLESENALVSVACINSGNTPNVIFEQAMVKGTVRTFDSKLRAELRDKITESAKFMAKKYDSKVEIDYSWQYPPLINDDDLVNKFIVAAEAIIPKEDIIPLVRTFAAEDFAFFAEKVPAIHFRLGIAEDDKGTEPLHSPNFTVSDNAILNGIYLITNFILNK